MAVLKSQSSDELSVEDSKQDMNTLPITDVQITDAVYDFCRRLEMHGIFFKKPQTDGRKDQMTESRSKARKQIYSANVETANDELSDRCAYTVYSKTGRRCIVKVSPAGSLETSLILQAKKLRRTKISEDICLPLLIDHYYHHMSSTNFLLLEYCEYGSLDELLAERGTIPIHRQHIAKIFRGIATAIHFLHSQYIYHGTICTGNVLVDRNMTGRLTGLSKAQQVSNVMDKNPQLPAYAAPESIQPQAQPLPQDLFAIGIILYRCLIGRMPKRKPNGTVDYHGIKSATVVPPNPDMWRTTQLLLSERLEMRPTAGQLLHTEWVENASSTPIKQIFKWNS